MKKAAFPGSFDPPTLGHLNIIRRASRLFDELVVVVADNRAKRCLFSAEERIAMIEELIGPWSNVSTALCTGLVVDFLKERDIPVLLRGVRGEGDFSYEFELSMINRSLCPIIETFFMITDPEYFVLRSSSIKELAAFGADISGMVPPVVQDALRAKFPQKTG
jgi:pantetheine-phosphate adenylyltransferase